VTTAAVTPQIEGLPPGATVSPLSGGAAPTPQIEGLPPGATVSPIGSTPPPSDEDIPSPHQSALEGITGFMNDVYTGVTHGLAKTAMGVTKLDPSVPVIPQAQTAAAEPNANPAQTGGEFMENALEFLMGDEALKGLSYADKLKQIVPALKSLEKFPVMQKALGAAMRTGAVSGGQTAVKTGGDVPATIEAAGTGAVTGGVLEGGAAKLGEAIAHASPVESEVGGQKFTTPRPAEVPPGVQKVQTAGKQVIAQSAQSAAEKNLQAFGDDTRPLNNQGSGGANPKVITRPPITDVPAAVARVSSFGDAADEVEKSAKGAYDNLNQATGGKFSEVRDNFTQARKDAYKAGSVSERDAAQLRLDNATSAMRQLFDDSGGKVSQQDWKDANTAWTNSKTLRQVHDAVESTFDTDAGFSQRSGTYRGFNGNMLRQRLNRLTQTIGEPELNRVVGRDNMDNLRKVAELTRTNADRAKFGAAVQKVGGWLARESTAAGAGALVGHFTGLGGLGGAVGGEAAYMAARKVMQAVATNPKVGQQLTFAVESGARPEYFAPIIGQMIRDQQEQPSE
jgi:hypothetical protein